MSLLKFSRYLYAIDEIEIEFVVSVLNKCEDRALYWAFELYYSGFVPQLTQLLWKMYYDFYATINPSFEKYLIVKINQGLDPKTLGAIVKNFIIRRHNMDVFMIRTVVAQFDIEYDDKEDITNFIEKRDYLTIGAIIESTPDDKLTEVYKITLQYFVSKRLSIDIGSAIKNQEKCIRPKLLLLSKIITHCCALDGIKFGKSLYIHITEDNFTKHKTLEADLTNKENKLVPILPPYKILSNACIYQIDEYKYLSLFNLARETTDIKHAYLTNWLQHASFSPIWDERIKHYGGKISNSIVIFENDDDYELFHEQFNYEPDEQKSVIQKKSICDVENVRDWLSVYKEHNKYGFIKIDEDIIQQLEKAVY